ncbi:hypothetical protein J3F83DRAFT_721881 [Trichoderma novae-zelandiae]
MRPLLLVLLRLCNGKYDVNGIVSAVVPWPMKYLLIGNTRSRCKQQNRAPRLSRDTGLLVTTTTKSPLVCGAQFKRLRRSDFFLLLFFSLLPRFLVLIFQVFAPCGSRQAK